MDQRKNPADTLPKDGSVPRQGPVELNPADLAKVGGGLPNGTWPPAMQAPPPPEAG
jgi:hypothetical protein